MLKHLGRWIISATLALSMVCALAGSQDGSNAPENYRKYELDAGFGTGSLLQAGGSNGLNMARLSGAYFPTSWNYYSLSLGLEFSYNMIFDSKAPNGTNSKLVIFSLSPLLRYYIARPNKYQGFVEMGVGPSVISNVRLGRRKFGIQYAFQLFGGGGMRISMPHYAIITGLRFMHWSNAYISKKNSGVNIPLMFYIGFQI